MIKNSTTGSIINISEYNDLLDKYQDLNKQLNNSKTLVRKAGTVVKIAPLEKDFLYVRDRAVSAGNVIENSDGSYTLIPIDEYMKNFSKYSKLCRNANQNGDFFSHEELLKNYKSFIGKSIFCDHNDENVEEARGIILDAIYNPHGYFVELLFAVDKAAFPQLAKAIEKKYVTDTSMGCRCESATCSICGHVAKSDDDVCEHVLNYKGSTYNGLPVFEINNGVQFFENSLVVTGADPCAKILERVASKKGNRSNNFVPKYHNSSDNSLINEVNQRTRNGRINNMVAQLKDLPWS